jgi:hypothetical protein
MRPKARSELRVKEKQGKEAIDTKRGRPERERKGAGCGYIYKYVLVCTENVVVVVVNQPSLITIQVIVVKG